MKTSSWPFARQIASCLTLFFFFAVQVTAAAQQPVQPSAQEAQSAPPAGAQENSSTAAVNDSSKNANLETAAVAAAHPGASDAQQGQSAASGADAAEPGAGQEQNTPAKPVGTAAAAAPNAAGVAGSRLTGAVIAPAKQRRVHTMLIRVAVIVGACVAIGTVAALSRSSPSQPR